MQSITSDNQYLLCAEQNARRGVNLKEPKQEFPPTFQGQLPLLEWSGAPDTWQPRWDIDGTPRLVCF